MRKLTGALSFILMTVPFLARSAEINDIMLMHMKDKSVKEFILASKPEVTFENGEVIVWTAETKTRVGVEIRDVENFEFVNSSSVETIGEDRFKVSFDNETLTVKGLQEGSLVGLYDISGLEIAHAAASAGGEVRLDISELPAGVYIARGKGISIKVYRRQ